MNKRKTAMVGSVFGIMNVLLSAFGSIIVRRIFVSVLGTEYLGLTAIFSSILGMLLSIDCGVAGSLFYKIYKPYAEADEQGMITTFKLIRLAYLVRAVVIAFVGLIVQVFLPGLCKSTSIDIAIIYRCYGIYLVFAAVSYYVILYSFLLEAFQKRYLVSVLSFVTFFFYVIVQVYFLMNYSSYLIYLTLSVLQPVIVYTLCWVVIYRRYHFLFKKSRLNKEDLKELPQYIKMAVHTYGSVVAQFTDSFLISSFTSMATLGMFDNYKVIASKVSLLLDQITSSIKDPMRLLIAEGNKERVRETLDNINFFVFVVAGLGSLAYLSLITPFVNVWLGGKYILSLGIAAASSYTMFLAALNYMSIDTYYYLGCFKRDKISPIIEIVINLGISFILGRRIGIVGVLTGTVFYYLVQEILRSRRIFEAYWKQTSRDYLLKYFTYAFVMLLFIGGDVTLQTSFTGKMNPIVSMLVNFLIITVSFLGVVICLFRKTASYLYFVGIITGTMSKFKIRVK